MSCPRAATAAQRLPDTPSPPASTVCQRRLPSPGRATTRPPAPGRRSARTGSCVPGFDSLERRHVSGPDGDQFGEAAVLPATRTVGSLHPDRLRLRHPPDGDENLHGANRKNNTPTRSSPKSATATTEPTDRRVGVAGRILDGRPVERPHREFSSGGSSVGSGRRDWISRARSGRPISVPEIRGRVPMMDDGRCGSNVSEELFDAVKQVDHPGRRVLAPPDSMQNGAAIGEQFSAPTDGHRPRQQAHHQDEVHQPEHRRRRLDHRVRLVAEAAVRCKRRRRASSPVPRRPGTEPSATGPERMPAHRPTSAR